MAMLMVCQDGCPDSHDCKCPLFKDEDILQCGSCEKCRRQASTMDSSFMTEEGTLVSDTSKKDDI